MWGYGYLIVVIYRYLLLAGLPSEGHKTFRSDGAQWMYCQGVLHWWGMGTSIWPLRDISSTVLRIVWLSRWACGFLAIHDTTLLQVQSEKSLNILIHLIPAWLLLLSWLPSLLNLPGQATGIGDAFQLVLVATLEQCNTATSEPRTRHGTSMTYDMTWSWVMSVMVMS